MANKILKTRSQQKRAVEADWKKASGFIPLRGEIIVYEADENYSAPRLKIGDGNTNVNDLPFVERDFSNSIKNIVAGGEKSLKINDVSPITHKCSLRLISDIQEPSRNLYNKTSHSITGGMNPDDTHTGYNCITNVDGSVAISGDGMIFVDLPDYYGDMFFEGMLAFTWANLTPGETYTFSLRSNIQNDSITTNTKNYVVAYGGTDYFDIGSGIEGYISDSLNHFTFTANTHFTNYSFICYINTKSPITLYPQLEIGTEITEWQPYSSQSGAYVEDFSTVVVTIGDKTYTPTIDGILTDIASISPTMEITTDNEHVSITDFTYNVDIQKYIDNKPGVKNAEGGEIFNLYEPIYQEIVDETTGETIQVKYENKAIAPYTHTEGYNNIAGGKAFNIINHYASGVVDAEGNSDGIGYFVLDSVEGIEVGDAYCYEILWNYDFKGEVLNIDIDTNTVKVSGYTLNAPGEDETFEGYFWIPSKPEIGTETVGTVASVRGYNNKAVRLAASAEGYDNIAAGKFSSVRNRGNIAGWGSDASGRSTKAIGNVSHTEGQATEASGSYSHAQNNKTKALGRSSHAQGENSIAGGIGSDAGGNSTQAMYDYQTTRGTFNLNKEDTLFEVGNGTAENDRQNAFEVYKDGHAEILTMGDTLRSVVSKEYVDNSTAGKKTPEGGEIFNDYTNNKAYGLYSVVKGTNNTAGLTGYNYSAMFVSSDDARIYLTTEKVMEATIFDYELEQDRGSQYLDETFVCDYSVGDTITITTNYSDITTTIKEISNNIIITDKNDTDFSYLYYIAYRELNYYLGNTSFNGDGLRPSNPTSDISAIIRSINEMDSDVDFSVANIHIVQDINTPCLLGTNDIDGKYSSHNLAYWTNSNENAKIKLVIKPYEGNTGITYLATNNAVGKTDGIVLGGPVEFQDITIVYPYGSGDSTLKNKNMIIANGYNLTFNPNVKFAYIPRSSANDDKWDGTLRSTQLLNISAAETNNHFNKFKVTINKADTQFDIFRLDIPACVPKSDMTFSGDFTLEIEGRNYGTCIRLGGSTGNYAYNFKKNLNLKLMGDYPAVPNKSDILRFYEGSAPLYVAGGYQIIESTELSYTFNENVDGVQTPVNRDPVNSITNILDPDGNPARVWRIQAAPEIVKHLDFYYGTGYFKVPSQYTVEIQRKGDDTIKYMSNNDGIVDLSSMPGEYKVIALYENTYYQSKNLIYSTSNPIAGNIGYGKASSANGKDTIASGDYSYTNGLGTRAFYEAQTAIGKYNDNKSNTLFEIGNGNSDSKRNNAFEVYKDGHAEVRTAGTSDNSIVIKSSLDKAISELVESLGSGGLTRQIVDVLPDVINASENVIYMVRNNNENEHNVYDEFMIISGVWEIIGSTAVDLGDIPGKKTQEGGEIFNDYSNNKAIGNLSHAEGKETTASGVASHAEGYQTQSTGYYAHSEGRLTQAVGSYTHAEGYQSFANANAAHAEGQNTQATAEGSHSEGTGTQATSRSAHAEGKDTIASAYEAHAEGQGTTAKSYYTHAEGQNTIAGGDAVDKGQAAHAEGRGTAASGSFSHAGGNYTFAIGEASFTHGFRLNAKEKNQAVVGQCNADNANALFIIGNGSAPTNRSNAFEVYKDGHAEVKAMGETDNSVATRKFVMDNISNGNQWELINQTQVTSNDVNYISFNTDSNGNPLELVKARLVICTHESRLFPTRAFCVNGTWGEDETFGISMDITSDENNTAIIFEYDSIAQISSLTTSSNRKLIYSSLGDMSSINVSFEDVDGIDPLPEYTLVTLEGIRR